jgi:hypothetical protein
MARVCAAALPPASKVGSALRADLVASGRGVVYRALQQGYFLSANGVRPYPSLQSSILPSLQSSTHSTVKNVSD